MTRPTYADWRAEKMAEVTLLGIKGGHYGQLYADPALDPIKNPPTPYRGECAPERAAAEPARRGPPPLTRKPPPGLSPPHAPQELEAWPSPTTRHSASAAPRKPKEGIER